MVKVPLWKTHSSVWTALAISAILWLPLKSTQASSDGCGSWPAPEHLALQNMQICGEPPISRRLGDVCTELRWLCSEQTIEAWIDRLMTQSTTEWFVHRLEQGLVFAQWSNEDDSSMGLFWSPKSTNMPPNESGVRIMVSRLRAIDGISLNRLNR